MSWFSSKKKEFSDEPIIQERIIKVNGDPAVKSYRRGKFLGKGGFAKVYEFYCQESKELIAGKILPKTALIKARARQKLMNEIKIHRSLHHKNIVGFDHYFEDGENIYILLELCTNQTLCEVMRRRKRITEIEVQYYIFQLIQALRYLHTHKVIHRDIKLGNLFITDQMELKLGDFGLAAKVEFDGERKRTICGTPNYIAPEVIDGRQGHSYEVDIWSVGALMFTLLVGKAPFEAVDLHSTYQNIKTLSYSFPEHLKISKEAKMIIGDILKVDPAERPSLDQILSSPFFTRNPIPKQLPASTLAVPPSNSFLHQYNLQIRHTINGYEAILERGAMTARENIQRVISFDEANENARNGCAPLNVEKGWESAREKITGRQISSESGWDAQEKARSTPAISERGCDTPISPSEKECDMPASERVSLTPASKKKVTIWSSYSSSKPNEGPMLWIKKWVDYSDKYGVGFMLSDLIIGVYFNDATKMIIRPNSNTFHYITKQAHSNSETIIMHTLQDFPKELNKKVTLLQHFHKNLLINEKIENSNDSDPLVYVKKWLATTQAHIFRLSNNIVQVFFIDKTELMLCDEGKTVVYVDKLKAKFLYSLSNVMDSGNTDLSKRLRYTKEALKVMLQNQNPAQLQESSLFN
ncbi:unnamed protein product [Blepharisma stoltei]|uniref:Serine/threonine-protein kinase PLK n=1 Tax=Blepharisma stoltei TaxID=1481888 RepID=A0AAU9IJ50_9CILI|nr:unnamed protein product [Blepharisma stoltei]